MGERGGKGKRTDAYLLCTTKMPSFVSPLRRSRSAVSVTSDNCFSISRSSSRIVYLSVRQPRPLPLSGLPNTWSRLSPSGVGAVRRDSRQGSPGIIYLVHNEDPSTE